MTVPVTLNLYVGKRPRDVASNPPGETSSKYVVTEQMTGYNDPS